MEARWFLRFRQDGTTRRAPLHRLPATIREMTDFSPQSDIERSYSVEPVEELIAEMDSFEDEWSEGWALYGQGGLYGDIRKSLLDVTAMQKREELRAKKDQKVTDGLVEELAHADEHYRQFIDEHVIRRAEWVRLDQRRKKIEMRYNRGQGILRKSAVV